jgi:hypothetical protein
MQCLSTIGSLIILHISSKDAMSLNPAKYIGSNVQQKEDEPFRICEIQWLHRNRSSGLNGTYLEGSMRGNLWVRDINYENEKMIRIPTEFQDKVKHMHYNGEKNIVFASSRDGRLKCWKLPLHWTNPLIEQINKEYDHMEEKRKLKLKEKA